MGSNVAYILMDKTFMAVLKKHRASYLIAALISSSMLVYPAMPVIAQETQPGDACLPAIEGHFRRSADDSPGPAITGQNFLFCNGSNWQGFMRYDDPESSVIFTGPSSAPADATYANSEWSLWLDEANDEFEFKARKSDGTIVNGTLSESVFERNGTVIRNAGNHSNEDFVFGSSQLGDTGAFANDARFFFDKSKAAFRAGRVASTQWDDGNVGTNSIAMGQHSRASGSNSMALSTGGYYGAITNGASSIAIGAETASSGRFGTALGYAVKVGDDTPGLDGDGNGNYSMGIGLGPSLGTQQPRVTGDNSLGIFMGSNNNENLTQSNTMAVFGGNLGIGTLAPSVELEVAGSIEYSGTIADVSDQRLKDNIQDLPEGQLDKILQLQGVSFTMRDDESKRNEFGFIAQDVQPIYASLVHETGEDKMLSLNYIGLIPPLIEALKEQNEIIEQHSSVIEKLEARIQALEESRN